MNNSNPITVAEKRDVWKKITELDAKLASLSSKSFSQDPELPSYITACMERSTNSAIRELSAQLANLYDSIGEKYLANRTRKMGGI